MLGSEYRWLLRHPLVRGSLLTLGFALFCLGCLILPALPGSCLAYVPEPVAAVEAVANDHDPRAAWPRAMLRLWILLPQLSPAP